METGTIALAEMWKSSSTVCLFIYFKYINWKLWGWTVNWVAGQGRREETSQFLRVFISVFLLQLNWNLWWCLAIKIDHFIAITRLNHSLSKQWQKAIQSAFSLIMWLCLSHLILLDPVSCCLNNSFFLSGAEWGIFLQWLPHNLISVACTMWRSFIFLR